MCNGVYAEVIEKVYTKLYLDCILIEITGKIHSVIILKNYPIVCSNKFDSIALR